MSNNNKNIVALESLDPLYTGKWEEITRTVSGFKSCLDVALHSPITIPIDGLVQSAGEPTIYNVTAALANTEYSQALTAETKQFTIRVRGCTRLQLAFVSGQSGTNYVTVPAGSSYTPVNLSLTGKTLYFQVSKAAQVVEIVEWV